MADIFGVNSATIVHQGILPVADNIMCAGAGANVVELPHAIAVVYDLSALFFRSSHSEMYGFCVCGMVHCLVSQVNPSLLTSPFLHTFVTIM